MAKHHTLDVPKQTHISYTPNPVTRATFTELFTINVALLYLQLLLHTSCAFENVQKYNFIGMCRMTIRNKIMNKLYYTRSHSVTGDAAHVYIVLEYVAPQPAPPQQTPATTISQQEWYVDYW